MRSVTFHEVLPFRAMRSALMRFATVASLGRSPFPCRGSFRVRLSLGATSSPG